MATNGDHQDPQAQQGATNTIPRTRSQAILQAHYPRLERDIDLHSLYPHLVRNDLLTQHLRELLLIVEITEIKRKQQLLTALMNNQQDFIDKFIRSLRGAAADHPAHGEMAELLQNTDHLDLSFVAEKKEQRSDFAPEPDQERRRMEDEDHPLADRQAPSFCGVLHAVCCRALMCYICGFMAVAVLSLATVVAPTMNWYQEDVTELSVLNSDNQTVVVPLKHHLHSFSLIHSWEHSCTLEAALLPCGVLLPNHTKNVTDPRFFSGQFDSFFYLLNQSQIYLSYDSQNTDVTSVSFWVLKDLAEYKNLTKNKPPCLEINKDNQDFTKCRNFSATSQNEYVLNILIDADSFYFIYCIEESVSLGTVNCNGNYFLWNMDVYWYNFSLYSEISDARVDIKNTKNSLVVRKAFLDPFHFQSELDQCLLIRTPGTLGFCENDSNGITVKISDIVKVADVWFLAVLVIVVILCVYFFISLVCHGWLYRRERKRLRELPEVHRMGNRARNVGTDASTAVTA